MDGGHTSQISDGTITGNGVSITMPIGDMSLTASSSETDESGTNYASTGAALTMTAGNGTLVLVLNQQVMMLLVLQLKVKHTQQLTQLL